MKYSVIIPTLGLSKRTPKLLADLVECELVGEVILIHNAETELTKIEHEKILHCESVENLFVNPSWNLGVELANFDHVALCNDDINFDPNIAFSVNTGDCIVERIMG